MKELIIKFTPFVFKQTVFIHEDDTIKTIEIPQKELASYISLEPNIDTVHLFGNEKIIRKIQEECCTKYNLLNINFKIN